MQQQSEQQFLELLQQQTWSIDGIMKFTLHTTPNAEIAILPKIGNNNSNSRWLLKYKLWQFMFVFILLWCVWSCLFMPVYVVVYVFHLETSKNNGPRLNLNNIRSWKGIPNSVVQRLFESMILLS